MTRKYVTYNDKTLAPRLILGTVNIRGNRGKLAIKDAIANGYRAIDSSTNYDNEAIVGRAVLESQVPRDQIKVTSKLPGKYHKYDDALMIIQEQIARMGLDYIDKYLVHWPNPDDNMYVEAWRALIRARDLGMVRTIGVSNFEPVHLDRIIDETGVVPSINQIESHPYFPNDDLHSYNKDLGIVTESWTTVGRDKNDLRENKTLEKIAKSYGKSIVQIIIRWQIQRDISPLVKAARFDHQRENLDVFDFDLSDEDMDRIMSLGREDGRVEDQDPHIYHEYV